MSFRAILRDITTTANGQTFDVVRLLAVGVTVGALAFEGFDLWHNHAHFEAQPFLLGFGGFFGGVGAGINLKRKDEPGQGDQ